MNRKGKTSQRTILFRRNVNRDNKEWTHFLEGYRKWLMDWDMPECGDDWHTAEDIVSDIFLGIILEPLITNLRPDDSFRHTLIVLCKHAHRDLTPLHLGWKNGRLAFIDFDSAQTFSEAARNTDCIGTDPYIAPEVASQGKLSVQSDLFALATILIERCPRKQRDCFEPVLRECLRPDPAERPGSAAESAARLGDTRGKRLMEILDGAKQPENQ